MSKQSAHLTVSTPDTPHPLVVLEDEREFSRSFPHWLGSRRRARPAEDEGGRLVLGRDRFTWPAGGPGAAGPLAEPRPVLPMLGSFRAVEDYFAYPDGVYYSCVEPFLRSLFSCSHRCRKCGFEKWGCGIEFCAK